MDQIMAAQSAADAAQPYVMVDQQRIDLTENSQVEINLSFAPCVWDLDLFLVIDLYSAANPVHPAGHVGWWKWPLETKGELVIEISRSPQGYAIKFDGNEPEQFWVNPAFQGLAEPVIALHIVLRPVLSEAVRFDDILHLYNSREALRADDARRQALDNPTAPAPSTPWYVWPRESMVHLVTTNVFERDAVGNFTLDVYRLLRANGIACQLYASSFDPSLRDTVRHTCELLTAVAEDDVVLVNFSIFEPWLPKMVELPGKKVLYFHNITPPRFLQVYDAEYAQHCADGISQLKYLDRFDALMANSASSARALQDAFNRAQATKSPPPAAFVPSHGPFEEASRLLEKAVVALASQSRRQLEITTSPPVVGAKAWQEIADESMDVPSQGTLLLYVGRMAPHKRIEDLFALFDRYHKLNPDSALLVVGGGRFEGYMGFLRFLLNNEYAAVKDHIRFYDQVRDGQLKTLYERCSAVVTMSEHEGFCVPIVEAMAFGKPVFAFGDAAVVETLGASGRVFYNKDFKAIAADIDAVLSTPWIERLVVEEQHRRHREIVEAATGRAFWSVFKKVLYGARPV